MSRYINLADEKGRNAEVIFSGITKKPLVKMITPDGKDTHTQKVLKGKAENSYEGLMLQFKDDEHIADAIIKNDADIDLEMTGRFLEETNKIYIDKQLKPVSKISKKEIVYNPDGTQKEERAVKESIANILSENPVKPNGKLFSKKEMSRKLVFAKKYQISHVNGLTFDFLFEMAKMLHEKESIIMLGGGVKGNEPLVFQDGGKSYRAFLEGRVKDNSYLLLLHLSNLELKGVK
jgi:hypothetical protein